jgi:hypothetical protein
MGNAGAPATSRSAANAAQLIFALAHLEHIEVAASRPSSSTPADDRLAALVQSRA